MRTRKPLTPAELEERGQLTLPDLFAPRDLRWPADWPTDSLDSLDDDSLTDEAARALADRLLALTDGADVRDWRTWEALADAQGCRTEHFSDIRGEPCRYTPALPQAEDGGAPVFAINYALPSDTIIHAWVHVWAHHELYQWMPPRLRRHLDRLRDANSAPEPDNAAVRICRRVETLLLG